MENLEQKISERTEQLADVVNKLLSSHKRLEKEIRVREAAEKALQKKHEELVSALEKERDLGALKSRFISIASHEFRTPLSTIFSSTSLAEKYADAGNVVKRNQHLDKIRHAVNHLTGIIEDMLSLTRLEEGQTDHQPAWFDFSDLLRETAEELAADCKPGQLIVYDDCPEKLQVYLDPGMTKNILHNLLSNALKYSEKSVFCHCKTKESILEFSVHDYGIGIPQQEQKHLFERFFRASNATNIQGVGLGLNIVRRYLDIMNGSIWFRSTEGGETTFTVRFNKATL